MDDLLWTGAHGFASFSEYLCSFHFVFDWILLPPTNFWDSLNKSVCVSRRSYSKMAVASAELFITISKIITRVNAALIFSDRSETTHKNLEIHGFQLKIALAHLFRNISESLYFNQIFLTSFIHKKNIFLLAVPKTQKKKTCFNWMLHSLKIQVIPIL